MRPFHRYGISAVLFCSLLLGGCGFSRIGGALNSSLLDQRDPQLVRDGAPTYLLLADAMIAVDPDDQERLAQGALLYSFYGSAFVDDVERARILAQRARFYGERALCSANDNWCGLTRLSLDELDRRLIDLDDDDLSLLYAATISWLYDIKSNSGDWGALADLPKVELLLTRMLKVDERFEHGSLHCYLGILKTLRPAALGGDPEGGRDHLLRAIELSAGRDLSFRVELAASYARLIYDRELHDRTLQEVVAADVEVPGLTLINVLAQRRARQLLQSADEYF
jgi:hypothetical protein